MHILILFWLLANFSLKASAQSLPSDCTTTATGRTIEILKIPTQAGVEIFEVYCELGDLDEKPWLVIFLRKEPKYEYGRWQDYTEGYHTFSGNYFIGLQRLYTITNRQPHELMLQLRQRNGMQHYMHFEHFAIANETSRYGVVSSGAYVGTMPRVKPSDWLPWLTETFEMTTRMKISIRPAAGLNKRKPKNIEKIKWRG
ncbi:angiopoietin-related protein 3-like [Bactrocera tryoni]|uniref:angiopoietin-related protein 3-like n=1 Tax=Bactrocera tryoni TaxID=59916 RepID=UPI001A95E5C7|nr:angiopoietin-related protein 3-like [Bactrocera tryoni]